MAERINADAVGEIRAASTADGGTALSTTAAFIAFPRGANYLTLTPRNFATAVVAKFSVNPFLVVLKTTDSLAALSNLTDASEALQDSDTGTSLSMNSFDTLANGDILYVGSHIPFRGVRIIIGSTNSTSSVLTVKYRKSDDTWADITATDGTDSGGATLAQTGNVTWTLPTDWKTASLFAAGDTTLRDGHLLNPEVYWTRWEVSAALDATVTITGALAMNRVTTYAELASGQSWEQTIHKGWRGIGCVEALTDAGTANLIVNAMVLGVGGKLS